MRVSSVTTMKNEGPFLLEWVAYHRLIGVNDILVFSNDCTDGTEQMLERLDEMGLVRHYPNPSFLTGSSKFHLQVIRYANGFPRLRRSDWVVSLDVDEFICVNAGQGRLEDLFNATADANVIVMSQHNFGHGGVERFRDAPLTEQFRYSWSKSAPYHRAMNKRGTKSLTHRSSNPREWHNHSPIFAPKHARAVRGVNGSGRTLPPTTDYTRDIKALVAPNYGFDLVQLNHYALRSVDSFLLKIARGNANHPDAAYQMGYWRKYDRNDHFDDKIQRQVARINAAREELLTDPELRRLHQASVAQARTRIEELRGRADIQSMLSRIGAYCRRNPGLLRRANQDASDALSISA